MLWKPENVPYSSVLANLDLRLVQIKINTKLFGGDWPTPLVICIEEVCHFKFQPVTERSPIVQPTISLTWGRWHVGWNIMAMLITNSP
jgi:hypothetical protein